RGFVTCRRGSRESESCARWEILPIAAAGPAGSFVRPVVFRDARSLRASLFRHGRPRLRHVLDPGPRNSSRHLSLASHASGAHVRQPFLRPVAIKRMRHLRRLIPRSTGRLLVACLLAVLVAIVFAWWLPIPNELQKSPSGTLTLLDCRGRRIAELASADART